MNLTKAFEGPMSPAIVSGLTTPDHLHHPNPCQFQQQPQQQPFKQHFNNYNTNIDYGCYMMSLQPNQTPSTSMMKGSNLNTVNSGIKAPAIHNNNNNNNMPNANSENYQHVYQSSGINKEIRDLEKDWETHIASMEQVK